MMDHGQAEMLLADYADGCLPDPQATEIEKHTASCRKCTEWLSWYREVKDSLATASDHVSAGDLAMLAVGSQDLPADLRSRIEDHVEACPDCRDLLSRSRSALEPATVVTPFRRYVRRALPLAAALVLGILGGRVMWRDAPRGGVVTYRVLGPSARAVRDLPEVALSKGVDTVLLAVDVPSIQGLGSEDFVRVVLSDDRENTIWETEIGVEEVRRRSADGRMLLVAVPAGALHRGRFVIGVVFSNGTRGVEFPFVVIEGTS